MAKKTKEQEIKILRDNLDNPNIPEQFKPDMRKLLEKLESETEKRASEKPKPTFKDMVRFNATGISDTTVSKIREIAVEIKREGPGFYITVLKTQLSKVYELLDADGAEYEKQSPATPSPKQTPDYDCDELIETEKARLKKRREAAAKRAKKPEEKKQIERIESTGEVVENSIKKRIDSGEKVSKKEVLQLIKALQEQIDDLKKLLKELE